MPSLLRRADPKFMRAGELAMPLSQHLGPVPYLGSIEVLALVERLWVRQPQG